MGMDGMKTSRGETTHWDMAGQRFPAKHAADSECMGARILGGFQSRPHRTRSRSSTFFKLLVEAWVASLIPPGIKTMRSTATQKYAILLITHCVS